MTNSFAEAPCTEVVASIDASPPNELPLDAQMLMVGRSAMAFGFLLGYEAALGPLSGERETVLQNFRQACAADPDRSGIEVLQGLSGD